MAGGCTLRHGELGSLAAARGERWATGRGQGATTRHAVEGSAGRLHRHGAGGAAFSNLLGFNKDIREIARIATFAGIAGVLVGGLALAAGGGVVGASFLVEE